MSSRQSGTGQRFGIRRPGSARPFLSDAYSLPEGFDEGRHHQLELWENFLRHFGLDAPLDCSAFPAPKEAASPGPRPGPIGLIAGS